MKRRALYRLGKALEPLGRALEKPGRALSAWAMALWDENCDCEKCIERRARYAAQSWPDNQHEWVKRQSKFLKIKEIDANTKEF